MYESYRQWIQLIYLKKQTLDQLFAYRFGSQDAGGDEFVGT